VKKVAWGAPKRLEDGSEYTAHPGGAVPALQLEDGSVLTEGIAISSYIASRGKSDSGLVPAYGSLAYFRELEKLSFVTSEIHKGLGGLFTNPPADVRDAMVKRVQSKFAILDKELASHAYLVGDGFTLADAYLYTVFRWCPGLHADTSAFPVLEAYIKRIGELPAVQAALKREGASASGDGK